MNEQNTLFHDFAYEWITREHGLPSHQIHQMLFLERMLWLATPNGLAVFDGEQVRVLDQKNGLLTHGIRGLARDGDYILVCSDIGVDILDAKSMNLVTNISTVDLGLGCCEGAMKVSSNNYILACANGLRIWDTQSQQLKLLNSPVDDDFIVNMVCFDQNTILIQSKNSGLWLYQEDKFQPFVRKALAKYGTPKKIFQQQGFIWLITDSFVIQLDTDFHIIESIALPKDFEDTRAVYYTDIGELYLANSRSLIVMTSQQGQWQINRLINDDVLVNTMSQDTYGNLWIATDFSGLMKVSALTRWITCYRSERKNSILSIQSFSPLLLPIDDINHLEDAEVENHLLVGGTGYSFFVPKQLPELSQEIISLRGLSCWDLNYFSDLGFWAATDKGLIQFDSIDQVYVKRLVDENLGAGRCLARFQNNIIYGNVSGLYLYQVKEKVVSPLHGTNQHSIGYVYAIKAINPSSFYIATLGNGVWLYNCISQKLQKAFSSVDLFNVYAIDIDSHNRTIIAADNKVWLIDNESMEQLLQVDESVAAWCAHWHSPTEIVLGTSQGLKLFNLVGKKCSFIIENYPKQKFWEFTTTRSLLKQNNAQYWCGLNEGLQSVNIMELAEKIKPPVPEIKNIECDDVLNSRPGFIELREGSWCLKIRLGSFWLWQEHALHYQYRVVGLHSSWHKLDGSLIELTTLPAGEYILEVTVTSSLAQASQSHQLLKITVKNAHFWGKFSAKASSGFNAAIDKYRTLRQLSSMRHEYEKMEHHIQQRTLELSDANNALSKLNTKLENLSNRDQLTGLYNRRYFFEQLDSEIKRAMRDEKKLTVMMIDIDFFKPYNDNYGHLEGDICLTTVAQALQSNFVRSGELIARFGGEEFIVLIHNTDEINALALANKCVQSVLNLQLPHEHSDCEKYVTISIGLATQVPSYQQGTDSWSVYRQQLINQADQALYLAKSNGRNRAQYQDLPEIQENIDNKPLI